ncbi:hypothetical protein [Dactylosporangium sp. CS-033363]|uniref:hypothetical protein n=1 Tax=Dactylosporangium sp. CS-033363 TaxID=3239935 RepID=UPI003D93BB79
MVEQEDAPGKRRRFRWPSSAAWTSIGSIATVAGIVLAVFAWRNPQSPVVEPTPPAVVAVSEKASGQGSGNPTGDAIPSVLPSVSSKTSKDLPFTATVTVNEHACEGSTGYHVVPPERVASVKPRQGAMPDPALVGNPDAAFTDVVVTLQGRPGATSVLSGMTVHVVQRGTPAGVAYHDGDVECGGLQPAFFGIDLDKSSARAVAMAGPQGDDPARPFPFKVSESDPEVFHIYGITHHCDCLWYVDIDWSSGGRTGFLTIDDSGHPFRTVGTDDLDVVDLTQDYQHWAPPQRKQIFTPKLA